MKKPNNAARKVQTTPGLRERSERLRDATGRFTRRAALWSDADVSAGMPPPPIATVPKPANSHPDAYALRLDAFGAGLRCPPGSAVIVEPLSPNGAGLAVLYRKGGGAEIWDITHNFAPGMFDVGEGAAVVPRVEVIAPETGRRGHLDVRLFEKAHRVVGVYLPDEIMQKHRPLPPDLALMTECPDGMVLHSEDCAAAYPLVRHGETVVVDPSKRELVHGALCLLEWSNGSRSILMTHHRTASSRNPPAWWVDPVNRPANREAMERLQQRGGMLFTSDGPYEPDHLLKKIVGTVIGVLVPGRARRAALPALSASEPLAVVVQTRCTR